MRIYSEEVQLPWPDQKLSPNAAVSRIAKAKVYAGHKRYAALSARKQLKGFKVRIPEGKERLVGITLIVAPPSHRRMDEDNMLARCKAYIDGIAGALGIDDCRFHYREQEWLPVTEGGFVSFVVDYEKPDDVTEGERG